MDKFYMEKIIETFRKGNMLILVDDENRENEGDLIVVAETISVEKVNFYLRNAKGLFCVAILYELVEKMRLPIHPRSEDCDDFNVPFFTYSLDSKNGITTGVSAQDRVKTIKLLTEPNMTIKDFIFPGHVFPLQARKNRLFERRGHTEAAVELAILAGVVPVVVMCEILAEDGKSANSYQLKSFAKEFDLNIISIKMISEYINQMHPCSFS